MASALSPGLSSGSPPGPRWGSTPASAAPAALAPSGRYPRVAPVIRHNAAATERMSAKRGCRMAIWPSSRSARDLSRRTRAAVRSGSPGSTPSRSVCHSPSSVCPLNSHAAASTPASDPARLESGACTHTSARKWYSYSAGFTNPTAAPLSVALRIRCARIGTSLRRFEPTTSTPSMSSRPAMDVPRAGHSGSAAWSRKSRVRKR